MIRSTVPSDPRILQRHLTIGILLDSHGEVTGIELSVIVANTGRAVIRPPEIPVAVRSEHFSRLTARPIAVHVHEDPALTIYVVADEDPGGRNEHHQSDQRHETWSIPHVRGTSSTALGYRTAIGAARSWSSRDGTIIRNVVVDMKRSIASILLIPGMLAAAVLILAAPTIVDFFRGPSDDPSLLCMQQDPSPVAEAHGAQIVLQACAAGKTFKIQRGESVAVDLTGSGGVDTSGTFHDLTVSDSSILSTVVAPNTIYLNMRYGERGRFFDFFAVYKGARSGRATISALLSTCANVRCKDTNRWRATVDVA